MESCSKYCAKKSVEAAGGEVEHSYKVPDYIKPHRGEDHGTGTYLTEDGWKVVLSIVRKKVWKQLGVRWSIAIRFRITSNHIGEKITAPELISRKMDGNLLMNWLGSWPKL